MRWARLWAAAIALLLCAVPVQAQERYPIDLPAEPLNAAIAKLSAQTGASIGASDIALSRYRSAALKGRYTLRQALSKLLAGTGLTFTIKSRRIVKITRRQRALRPQNQPPPQARREPGSAASTSDTAPAPSPAQLPPAPIIVTATKSPFSPARFPGSYHALDIAASGLESQAQGLSHLITQLPSTAQTNLGVGRNKIFLRGIADSSLVGATQSTVSLYLDEARINYGGAAPDLRLFDADRVEIIEGPQGTLYGAGTIGGIIKTRTNKPDPDALEGKLWSGGGLTRSGELSLGGAGMVNVPLGETTAMRVVGYAERLGGFIDDTERARQDINRTRILGGRATLRVLDLSSWTIDAGIAVQDIYNTDSQYLIESSGAFTRESEFAEPSGTNIIIPQLTLARDWDDMRMVSATSWVRKSEFAFYNTGLANQIAVVPFYREQFDSTVFAHETRVNWSPAPSSEVLIGASFLDARDEVALRLGTRARLGSIRDFRNRNREISLFSQATLPLAAELSLTLGARASLIESRFRSLSIGSAQSNAEENGFQFLPMAALTWQASASSLFYMAYREGFRAAATRIDLSGAVDASASSASSALGDTSSDRTVADVTAAIEGLQIKPDYISTAEAGWKFGQARNARLSGDISLYYSDWRNIQADVFQSDTFPQAANVGDGHSYGVSAKVTWSPSAALQFEASLFINESELTRPFASLGLTGKNRLPNIADIGGFAAAQWQGSLSKRWTGVLRAETRYVGQSQVGIDSPGRLNQSNDDLLSQGNYAATQLSMQLEKDALTLAVTVSNLFNIAGNTFAYGNPWTYALENSRTPLRPQTVSIRSMIRF